MCSGLMWGAGYRQVAGLVVLCLTSAWLTPSFAKSPAKAEKASDKGVAMAFSLSPNDGSGRPVRSGEEARLRFRLTDAATGKPLAGLLPAAWLDQHQKGGEALSCKDKIGAFMQGTLSYRPDISLNAWYIVTLNDTPNLTVIDPIQGYGGQNTLAMPGLPAPGEDAVVSADQKTVFVSTPAADRLAVIDAGNWKLKVSIDAGARPTRLVYQPDQRYLWVTNDTDDEHGGVSIIDPEQLRVVAQIATGGGPHELVFDDTGRHALVSNASSGTVSVIDTATRKVVASLEAGKRPVSPAYSKLGAAFYVVDEAEGIVSQVDAPAKTVRRVDMLMPGLRTLRIDPTGRWALIANYRDHRVHALDIASNRIVDSVDVAPKPYQITFSGSVAYVRSAEGERFAAIAMNLLEKEGRLSVTSIGGGKNAPAAAASLQSRLAIASTPEGASVLVTNPADGTVYYYMEGMNAPQGSFAIKGAAPRGVVVVNRALTETAPGEYTAVAKIPAAGLYDVALLVPSPRLWHCFTAKIDGNPGQATAARTVALQYLNEPSQLFRQGEVSEIRFRLTDGKTAAPITGVKDAQVLSFLPPGSNQSRGAVTEVGGGIYRAELRFGAPGTYMLLVQSPSLHLGYDQLPPRTLKVGPAAAPQ